MITNNMLNDINTVGYADLDIIPPCPRCGTNIGTIMRDPLKKYYVMCYACTFVTPSDPTPAGAIEVWAKISSLR